MDYDRKPTPAQLCAAALLLFDEVFAQLLSDARTTESQMALFNEYTRRRDELVPALKRIAERGRV